MSYNCLCVNRLFQLMEEIMAEKENKTIIFVETKKRCDDLTRRMRRDGSEMKGQRQQIIKELSNYVDKKFKIISKCAPLMCFLRWPAMCIHGDKSQPERDWVLSGKHSRSPPLTE